MKPILAPYVPIADLVAKTFGEDVEVVLHDLSDPQHSVVYVANNKVTGRQVGESFRHLITKAIHSPGESGDINPNFYFRHEGRLIRSSSSIIRDENGHIAGAFCINVDTTRITRQIDMLAQMLPGIDKGVLPLLPDEENEDVCPVDTNRTVMEIMTDLVDNITGDIPSGSMTREKRIELIRFMDQRGVFLVKGAIDRVAEKLGISKVTVYSYLDEVRGKR